MKSGRLSFIWSQGEEQQAPFVRALGLGVRCAAALAEERHPIDAAWLTATTAAVLTLNCLVQATVPNGNDEETAIVALEACIARTGMLPMLAQLLSRFHQAGWLAVVGIDPYAAAMCLQYCVRLARSCNDYGPGLLESWERLLPAACEGMAVLTSGVEPRSSTCTCHLKGAAAAASWLDAANMARWVVTAYGMRFENHGQGNLVQTANDLNDCITIMSMHGFDPDASLMECGWHALQAQVVAVLVRSMRAGGGQQQQASGSAPPLAPLASFVGFLSERVPVEESTAWAMIQNGFAEWCTFAAVQRLHKQQCPCLKCLVPQLLLALEVCLQQPVSGNSNTCLAAMAQLWVSFMPTLDAEFNAAGQSSAAEPSSAVRTSPTGLVCIAFYKSAGAVVAAHGAAAARAAMAAAAAADPTQQQLWVEQLTQLGMLLTPFRLCPRPSKGLIMASLHLEGIAEANLRSMQPNPLVGSLLFTLTFESLLRDYPGWEAAWSSGALKALVVSAGKRLLLEGSWRNGNALLVLSARLVVVLVCHAHKLVVGAGDEAASSSGSSAAAAQRAGGGAASDASGSGAATEAGPSSASGSAGAESNSGGGVGGSAADSANGQPGATPDLVQLVLLLTARVGGGLAKAMLQGVEQGKLCLSQPQVQDTLNQLGMVAARLRRLPLRQQVQQCAGGVLPDDAAGAGSDPHAALELLAALHKGLDPLALGLRLPGCYNPACANLSGVSEAELSSKLCSGCRVARYCCPECSKADWPVHKASCKRAAAQRQAAAAAQGRTSSSVGT